MSMKTNVTLVLLQADDHCAKREKSKLDCFSEPKQCGLSQREQFIRDLQEAFLYGATQEFGMRDDHFEEDGEIISRDSIEAAINSPNAVTYRILCDGQKVGGAVLQLNPRNATGNLDLFFVSPRVHSKGIGFAAWQTIEQMHPEIKVWETVTPYFEKRNIHFYVNRCGFHIVEFFNSHHPDPNDHESTSPDTDNEGMFRFRKEL